MQSVLAISSLLSKHKHKNKQTNKQTNKTNKQKDKPIKGFFHLKPPMPSPSCYKNLSFSYRYTHLKLERNQKNERAIENFFFDRNEKVKLKYQHFSSLSYVVKKFNTKLIILLRINGCCVSCTESSDHLKKFNKYPLFLRICHKIEMLGTALLV